MKRYGILGLFLLLVNVPLFAKKPIAEAFDIYFNKLVFLDPYETIQVGVIREDTTYFFSYSGDSVPGIINEHTRFEIGSVSKVFTASLSIEMQEAKVIDINEPVSSYVGLPLDVRLRDLLMHNTTFAKFPEVSAINTEPSQPYAYLTDEVMVEYLMNNDVYTDGYSYSHTNFALLGKTLETVADKPISDLYHEFIFNDLGMVHTSFSDTLLINGFSKTGAQGETWESTFFNYSMGLKSTVHDLTVFCDYLIHNPIYTGSFTPQLKTDIEKGIYVGYGWHMYKPKKRYSYIVSHIGVTNSHQTYIGLVPDKKTGIVVCSNIVHKNQHVGSDLLEMINNRYRN